MNDSKYNKIFSVFIVCVLTIVGVLIFILPNEEISTIENRKLSMVDSLKNKSYMKGEFQNQLEDVLSDQFLGRYNFVKIKKKLDYDFLNLAYFNTDLDLVLRPLGESGVSQIGNSKYMMDNLLVYDDVSNQRIIDKADQINRFQKRNSNIEVYVYLPVNLHETGLFDEANDVDSAGKYYTKTLEDSIEVPFNKLIIQSEDDIYKYYQSSDHHLNNKGLDKMYHDIMDLIGEEAKEPIDEDCHVGMNFYGTYSSRTGYTLEPDQFCKYSYDIGAYNVIYNDQMIKKTGENDFKNLNINEINEEYPYFYNYAYDSYEPLAMYDFKQENKKNVLLVGDSLSRGFIETFASSFNKTYRLVPYDYTMQNNKYFDYDKFVEENDIDIVIFCYGLVNYYYQDKWGDRWLQTTIEESSTK